MDFEPDEPNNIAHQQKRGAYRSQLFYHPDCSDPDHPGCEHCEGDEE